MKKFCWVALFSYFPLYALTDKSIVGGLCRPLTLCFEDNQYMTLISTLSSCPAIRAFIFDYIWKYTTLIAENQGIYDRAV